MNDPATPAIQELTLAATVILTREGESGTLELLMLERASSMVFAAGALVFPGGRVDADDRMIAETLVGSVTGTHEELAQRVAAIRETIEEAGIAIGVVPFPTDATIAILRNGLAEGHAFSALLEETGSRLDLVVLTPFARWKPPQSIVRRFDTRFFLAAAPPQAVEKADGNESVRAVWASAQSLLDDAEAGQHRIIFPTWCNLIRLAQFSSFDEAHADALRYGHHIATGRLEQHDGVEWICIDEGIGYPVTRTLQRSEMQG